MKMSNKYDIWNCLGIFPVTGQNKMRIGVPQLDGARVKLANGNTLSIKREGKGIYVRDVTFCGEPLATLSLPVSDGMRGGELVFLMTDNLEKARLQ